MAGCSALSVTIKTSLRAPWSHIQTSGWELRDAPLEQAQQREEETRKTLFPKDHLPGRPRAAVWGIQVTHVQAPPPTGSQGARGDNASLQTHLLMQMRMVVGGFQKDISQVIVFYRATAVPGLWESGK